MKLIRKHASFANVTSLMALTVALGGTAYAGVTLTNNSVASKHLKRGAVANSDIRNNAVTSAKVRNNSLRLGDFRAADRESLRGPTGATGARGATGATGPQGPAGANGADGSADAFARVQANGSLQPDVAGFPPQTKNIVAGNIVQGEAGVVTGNYCFNIEGRPASAMVSLDNADAAAADRNLVASVAIDRGEDLGDCPPTHNDARVRIVDGNTGAAQDARFFIWFEM